MAKKLVYAASDEPASERSEKVELGSVDISLLRVIPGK